MTVPPKLTLDEINNILTILDGNIDFLSDDEIVNYVNQITTGLPFQTLNFEKGFLYRGRPNQGNLLFTNTKDLWYPPLNCVKCNRFNDANMQILYVGDSKSTVIDEVQPIPGSLLTLITYEAISQISTLPIGIKPGVTKTNLFNSKFLQNLASGKMRILNNNANHMLIDQTINDYLYKHVTKENKTGDAKEYRFTNIYGDHFLKAPIDGILYPSVSRNLYDINMALKPDAVKKLKIIQVDVVKIRDKIPYQFELVACSNEFKTNGAIIYNDKCGSFDEMTRIFK